MDRRQMEENMEECWEALLAGRNIKKIMGVTFDMQMGACPQR